MCIVRIVKQIGEEIENGRRKHLFVVDVNFYFDPNYSVTWYKLAKIAICQHGQFPSSSKTEQKYINMICANAVCFVL